MDLAVVSLDLGHNDKTLTDRLIGDWGRWWLSAVERQEPQRNEMSLLQLSDDIKTKIKHQLLFLSERTLVITLFHNIGPLVQILK